jgi:ATP-binding cassette, subfamily C, bacterial
VVQIPQLHDAGHKEVTENAGCSQLSHHTLSARLKIARYFYRLYPKQMIVMLLGLGVSGILETVSIVTILPLLEVIQSQNTHATIHPTVERFFSMVGVPLTTGALLVTLTLLFGFKAVVHLRLMRYISFTTARISYAQRSTFLGLLLGARWSFYTTRHLGQFVNAALFESSKGSACFTALCQIAEAAFRAVLLIVAAALTSWQVSLAAILAGVILVKGLSVFMRISERTGYATANANKELSKRLTDALQNIKPLKAMGREERMFNFIERHSVILLHSYGHQLYAKYALSILREPVVIIFILSGFVIFTNFGVPFAQLIVLAALFYRAVNSWGVLQQNLQTLVTNESYFWSFREIMKEAEEQQEPHNGKHAVSFEKSIEFENVTFCYGRKTVLNNASFAVLPNRLTALVGVSGVGKTSIADLICALHHPQGGAVKIDGKDIRDINVDAWRREVGYVAQEFFVLNDTLRMNITLGDNSISDGEIWMALEEAGAQDFVQEMADGLNTQMGERGLNLSGGQRQRISLARALIKRPKLLILDEATTALDPVTEMHICQTLKSISRRTAVLAISHQKAIVDAADYVYEVTPFDGYVSGGNVHKLPATTNNC